MPRTFHYVNDYGRHKILVVDNMDMTKKKYHITIWDGDTGDFCGSGEKTAEELANFLDHYGIHFRVKED